MRQRYAISSILDESMRARHKEVTAAFNRSDPIGQAKGVVTVDCLISDGEFNPVENNRPAQLRSW